MLKTGKNENRETEFDYDAIGKKASDSKKTLLHANIYQVLSGVRRNPAVIFRWPQTVWKGVEKIILI